MVVFVKIRKEQVERLRAWMQELSRRRTEVLDEEVDTVGGESCAEQGAIGAESLSDLGQVLECLARLL